MDPVRIIDEDTVRDLAAGATLLGTGGGGDPRVGELMAIEAIRRYGPVPVISVDEVPAEGVTVPVAMIGAPTVIIERIPSGDELTAVMHGLEQLLDAPVVATMPIEAGGINSTFPLVLAARRGLPLVDADGMGRAFPEVQMVTLGVGGVTAYPLVLADETGTTTAITHAPNNAAVERVARAVVAAKGGSAVVAHYAARRDQLQQWAIRGSVSLAVAIGRQLRAGRHSGDELISALDAICGARRLFTGKIIDVNRATDAGFVRGTLTLSGIDDDTGRQCTIDFQNENLIAWVDGTPAAAVPDLISVIDADSGTPMTTERVKFGVRAHVVGIPASPLWWSEAGLPVVEPRAFGYDMDPIPLRRNT